MKWLICVREINESNATADLFGYQLGKRYRYEEVSVHEHTLTFYRVWRTIGPSGYDVMSEFTLRRFFRPAEEEESS